MSKYFFFQGSTVTASFVSGHPRNDMMVSYFYKFLSRSTIRKNNFSSDELNWDRHAATSFPNVVITMKFCRKIMMWQKRECYNGMSGWLDITLSICVKLPISRRFLTIYTKPLFYTIQYLKIFRITTDLKIFFSENWSLLCFHTRFISTHLRKKNIF